MRTRVQVMDATRQSWQGLVYVWSNEVAFRQYAMFAVMLTPIALLFGENNLECVLLLSSLLLVLLVEIINTAIEAVVDRIGEEPHKLSGAAKDIGSAAVVMSILIFALTWLILLFF